MSTRSPLLERLAVPLAILAGTHAVGTIGYRILWSDIGGTWLDALFMTFTTITTIGFGEIKPLDGAGRLLTMLVALGGIGSLFYTFTVILDFVTSGEVRSARRARSMQHKIDSLSDHFIVAGVGRVGREAASELRDSGHSFILVDTADYVETVADELGVPSVRGDASEDAVLERAGVKRAKGLIVTTSNDATNLYVVLSARLLNPSCFIASRAVDEAAVPKLLRAGANRAISPYAIGGKRLAHLMLSPGVVDFFETAITQNKQALSIGDMAVTPTAPAVGQTLAALNIHEATGAWLLAVVRQGNALVHPSGEVKLGAGDHVLALGTGEQLERLERLVAR